MSRNYGNSANLPLTALVSTVVLRCQPLHSLCLQNRNSGRMGDEARECAQCFNYLKSLDTLLWDWRFAVFV